MAKTQPKQLVVCVDNDGYAASLASSSGEAKVWAGTATDIVRRQPDGTWKLALDNPYGIE